MLSQMSYLLGEAGYYVLSVAVADETLKQNDMSRAGDHPCDCTSKAKENFRRRCGIIWDRKKVRPCLYLINS